MYCLCILNLCWIIKSLASPVLWSEGMSEFRMIEERVTQGGATLELHSMCVKSLTNITTCADRGEFHAYHLSLFNKGIELHQHLVAAIMRTRSLQDKILCTESCYVLSKRFQSNVFIHRLICEHIEAKHRSLSYGLYGASFPSNLRTEIEEYYRKSRSEQNGTQTTQLQQMYTVDGSLVRAFLVLNGYRKASVQMKRSVGRFTNLCSRGVSSVVSPVQWRSGNLQEHAIQLAASTSKKLAPFDLLFEKKGYKLTDYTIPGYWGHVAIYLGTKKQLKARGLWDLAEMDSIKKYVEKGLTVCEMRQSGVVFSSLKDWYDLDAVCAIRLTQFKGDSKKLLAVTLYAMGQFLDLKYDYGFNYYSTNKLSCTTLVSLTYGPIHWPTKKLMGRSSLSPDGMVQMVYKSPEQFEFLFYYTASGKQLEKKTKRDLEAVI
jgi:hypothetical protein